MLRQVVETYNKALSTINPRKTATPLYPLYVAFAKFYEKGGSSSQPDLAAARAVFDRATKVPYSTVEQLAEVWCEWAEMELRAE